jgi:hypothetical protein
VSMRMPAKCRYSVTSPIRNIKAHFDLFVEKSELT